jgi:hypothetical protein
LKLHVYPRLNQTVRKRCHLTTGGLGFYAPGGSVSLAGVTALEFDAMLPANSYLVVGLAQPSTPADAPLGISLDATPYAVTPAIPNQFSHYRIPLADLKVPANSHLYKNAFQCNGPTGVWGLNEIIYT